MIKLYAWELSFKKLIDDIRLVELRGLMKLSILNTIISFQWQFAPFLVSVLILCGCVLQWIISGSCKCVNAALDFFFFFYIN